MLFRFLFRSPPRVFAGLIGQTRTCGCKTVRKTDEHEFEHNPEEKLLRVAVIGTTNAGKSTFINSLMDRKVCATSSKVHTTRTKCRAVFTEGNSQIVFLDTPGLVNEKERNRFNLEKSFSKDSKNSLREADIIAVIHDASNPHTREKLDIKVIHLLGNQINTPSFLVLNKIDELRSKRKLLDIARVITENSLNGMPLPGVPLKDDPEDIRGWQYFRDIFMVSALTGDGMYDIKNYLISKSRPAKWLFPSTIWSDQQPEQIITNTVKAKFLDFLQQEIPYKLNVKMELFEINEKGVITTVVLVQCPTARIARLIAGVNDGRLKQITATVQSDLQEAFQNYVRIRIILKHPEEAK